MTVATIPQRYWIAAGLALLWGCLMATAQMLGIFDIWEEPLIDWRLSLPARLLPEDPDLALLTLDGGNQMAGEARSRLDYALVLRGLLPFGAQSYVLEPLLSQPDTQYGAFDYSLANVIARAEHVVLSAAALKGTSMNAADKSTRTPALPVPARVPRLLARGNLDRCPAFDQLVWPLEPLAARAAAGVANLSPEADGRLRRLPLVFSWQGNLIPSLALQAASVRLGASMVRTEVLLGESINLRDASGKLLRVIPIDGEGRMRLRYRLRAAPIWQANFDDALVYAAQAEQGATPERDLCALRGRQIWIGRTAVAPQEQVRTILGSWPPLRAQLLAVRNILDQDFLHPPSPMWLLLIFLAASVLGTLALLHWDWILGGCVLLILNISWIQIARVLFVRENLLLPLPAFVLTCLGAFAIALAARAWEAETPTREPAPMNKKPSSRIKRTAVSEVKELGD